MDNQAISGHLFLSGDQVPLIAYHPPSLVIFTMSVFPAPSSPRQRFWFAWSAWMLFVLGIHALTLAISPPVWQDEVQIIDFGRTVIEPGTDWSLSWNTATDSAVLNPLYLGGLLQNLAFSLSNYNILFPRFLSLVGAIAASTSCLLLLLSFGHQRLRSAVLSSILLLDPLFVEGYRGDRIDSWVIASVFLSCTALQRASDRDGLRQSLSLTLLLVSGAISAVGLSLWFSFVLLLPLVFWQMASVACNAKSGHALAAVPLFLRILFYWFVGFAFSLLLIQLPVLIGQPAAYRDLIRATGRVVASPGLFQSLAALLAVFAKSPLLLLLSVICIFIRPRLDLLFFAAIALVGILNSRVYISRVVYFLPYLIVHCSMSMHRFLLVSPSVAALLWARRGISSLCWLVLLVSMAVSLVLRPAYAFATRDIRQLSQLENVAIEAVGMQHKKVLIEPWEFYVPGRKLGWKMYNPYFDEFSAYQLSEMDYIIAFQQGRFSARLPAWGFSRVGGVWLERPSGDTRASGPGATGYGPYLIFKNNQR